VKRALLGQRAAFALAAIALTFAGAAYVALRDGLRLHAWVRVFGSDAVDRVRDAGRAANLPSWVRFTLPDALWQLALCLIVFAIWRGAAWTRAKTAWCAAAASFGVVIEVAQLAHLIEGTFDVADVIGSVAAVLVAAMIVRALTPPTLATTSPVPLRHHAPLRAHRTQRAPRQSS
jgi:hypothetical protein